MTWQVRINRWGPLGLVLLAAAFAGLSIWSAQSTHAAGNEYRTVGMISGTYSHRTGPWRYVGVGGYALDLRKGNNVSPNGDAIQADAPVYFQIKHISGSEIVKVIVSNYPTSCTGYRLELRKLSNNTFLGYLSVLHISKATWPTTFNLATGLSWNARYAGTLKWKQGDPGAPVGGTPDPETCSAWSGSHLHQEGSISRNDPFPYGTYNDFNVPYYQGNWIHNLIY